MIYHSVCRLSIFVICAEMLIHLRAKEKYEKYLKVCLVLMIAGMFLGQISKASETYTPEAEVKIIEEKLKGLREEEVEQAVDLFWQSFWFDESEQEGYRDAGEVEEDVYEG